MLPVNSSLYMPATTELTADARLAWLSATVMGILLLNHLVMAVMWMPGVATIIVSLVLICIATFLLQPYSSHWPFRLFLGVLIVICLGTPTEGWDSRSIWLFHAKRIYVDASLFAQFDDYAPWSHNDYPAFVPAIAAAIGATLGGWNEIAPKLSSVLALSPAVLLIASVVRGRDAQLVACLLFIVFGWTHLVDGYMDAVLGLQLGAAMLGIAVLVERAQHAVSPADPSVAWAVCCLLVAMPLVKNEGLPVALLALLIAWLFLVRMVPKGRPRGPQSWGWCSWLRRLHGVAQRQYRGSGTR